MLGHTCSSLYKFWTFVPCLTAFRASTLDLMVSESGSRWLNGALNPEFRPKAPPASQSKGLPAPAVSRRFREVPENAQCPLEPPAVRPRLRVRSTPVLHAVADPVPALPGPSLTAPGHLAPLRFHSAAPSLNTVRAAWDAALNAERQRWLDIVEQVALLLPAGHDVLRIKASDHATMHLLKLISTNAPSTLSSYFSRWELWMQFCNLQSLDAVSPDMVEVADFIHSHSQGRLGAAILSVKALRFIAKRLELTVLMGRLSSTLVKSFCVSGEIAERRETAPLPLSFVIFLERLILDGQQPNAKRLVAGCMLVAIWGSLRFSDAQWSSPLHLHLSSTALLGFSSKTKTTRKGMPFGVLAEGLLDRRWPGIWLPILQDAVRATTAAEGGNPDFLFAKLGGTSDRPLLLGPLSRAEAMLQLRGLLAECYGRLPRERWPDLSLIGVHSFKVTILSFAKQLNLREELRLEQGHHRPAGTGMAGLYGRDDVAGPLLLQKQVIAALVNGFRPLRAKSRGSVPPIPDIPVLIERGIAAPEIPSLAASQAPELELCTSSDSNCEKTKAGPGVLEWPSDSVTLTPLPTEAQAEADQQQSASLAAVASFSSQLDANLGDPEEFLFLLNSTTGVAHLAKACSLEHPAVQHRPSAESGNRPLRTGCSIRGGFERFTLTAELPAGARLCLKHGCGRDPRVEAALSS